MISLETFEAKLKELYNKGVIAKAFNENKYYLVNANQNAHDAHTLVEIREDAILFSHVTSWPAKQLMAALNAYCPFIEPPYFEADTCRTSKDLVNMFLSWPIEEKAGFKVVSTNTDDGEPIPNRDKTPNRFGRYDQLCRYLHEHEYAAIGLAYEPLDDENDNDNEIPFIIFTPCDGLWKKQVVFEIPQEEEK